MLDGAPLSSGSAASDVSRRPLSVSSTNGS
jgi:hypothetical protein